MTRSGVQNLGNRPKSDGREVRRIVDDKREICQDCKESAHDAKEPEDNRDLHEEVAVKQPTKDFRQAIFKDSNRL